MAKILAVDDSGFILAIMKKILEEGGYEVVEAHNGKEAVEQVDAESPDLVLLDIIMPDMDGLEVLKQIVPKTKVCMVTAIGQDAVIDQAKQAGALDYVTKPFEKEKVLETVKNLLG